jgi:4-amino-4-deoxy-L-arabinose transferase-like glycosyltransferase
MFSNLRVDKIGFCIVMLTTVYLSFAARWTLSSLFVEKHSEFGPITLNVMGNGSTPAGTMRLQGLLLDGHSIRFETIDFSRGWNLIDNHGMPDYLEYRNSEASSLSFNGKRFVVVLQSSCWSGTLLIQRGKQMPRIVDVPALDSPCSGSAITTTTIEDPSAPPSTAVFIGAFCLFLIPAWFLGPLRSDRSGIAWLIVFLSCVHLLYWAGQPVGLTNDSPGYLEDFQTVAAGSPGNFPPGYGAIVLLIGSLVRTGYGGWTTLLQHGMTILGAVWLYLLFRDLISERLAFCGALILAIVCPAFSVSQGILSESSASFFMVGGLYFAYRAVRCSSTKFALVSGFCTGYAGLTRGVPIIAVAPAIALLYLIPNARNNWKRLLVTGGATAVTFLTPVIWCGIKTGQPQLTNSMGCHLWDRIVFEQKLLNANGETTQRLLQMLHGKDPSNLPYWDVSALSETKVIPAEEKPRFFGKIALEAVSRNRWNYLTYTVRLFARDLASSVSWIPTWSDTPGVYPDLETPPPLPITASTLGWRTTLEKSDLVVWPILLSLGMAGVLFGISTRFWPVVLATAWIPVGYLFPTALLEIYCPRYVAPVIPFICMLAMVFLSVTVDAVRRRAKCGLVAALTGQTPP